MTTKADKKIEPAKAGAEPVQSAKAAVLSDEDIDRMIAQKEAEEAES